VTRPAPATVRDPGDLTPGWLTAALAAGGGPAAGVTVRSVRAEPVGTGLAEGLGFTLVLEDLAPSRQGDRVAG
jgi:hypothetical protein